MTIDEMAGGSNGAAAAADNNTSSVDGFVQQKSAGEAAEALAESVADSMASLAVSTSSNSVAAAIDGINASGDGGLSANTAAAAPSAANNVPTSDVGGVGGADITSSNSAPGTTVFVGGVPWESTEGDLQALFGKGRASSRSQVESTRFQSLIVKMITSLST